MHDNLRGNLFQLYPIQTQILNNVNVHFQPKIYPQHYYPNFATHVIRIIESKQRLYMFLLNPLVSLNATNKNLSMNSSNLLVNGFPSSHKINLNHQLLVSCCLHQLLVFILHIK